MCIPRRGLALFPLPHAELPHPFPVILSYVYVLSCPVNVRVMGFGSAYRMDVYPHPYDQIQYSQAPVERVSNVERLNVKPEHGAVTTRTCLDSILPSTVLYSAHMEVEFSSYR